MKLRRTLLSTGIALSLGGTMATAALGSTGSGITVAVIDSGVRTTHEDLRANIAPGGFDFFNNDSDPFDDSRVGHGTYIAGIIAAANNGIGATGVAYNAKILPIKVSDADNTLNFTAAAAGVDYAVAQGAKVLNLSIQNRYDVGLDAALARAAGAGRVVVAAAGNFSSGSPEFPGSFAGSSSAGGRAIAVGSVDGSGKISSFSNHAGSTMNFFLVAPGEGIYSTNNSSDSAYDVKGGGTSWSAAYVSGAAAALWSAYSHLSASQVVELLLLTATDLGAPGVDEVYGRGLVNLSNALSPQGGVSVPSGDSSGGGGMGLVALVLGGAVGYAILNRSETIKEAMVLDKYERAYGIDLTKVTEVRDDRRNLSGVLDAMHRSTHYLDVPLADNLRMTVLYALPQTPRPEDWDRFDPRFNDDVYKKSVAMTLQGGAATGLNYVFGINTDPTRSFGVMQAAETQGANFLSERVFTAPLMGFANTASSVNLGYNLSETTGVKFGYAATDEHDNHGLKSNAAVIEGAYKPNEVTTLRLQLGQLDETGSFFGGAAAGPLSARQAVTTSLGLSGAYQIAPTLSLIASYTEGYTRVRADQNGLLRGFSGIHSRAWGLGLVKSDLFTRGDRFGMALSQPLRVTRGTVDLSVPYARDFAGNVYRHNETVSLAPDGSERSLDAFYNLTVAKNVQAGAHFMYSHQPQHNAAVDDATTLLFTLQSKF